METKPNRAWVKDAAIVFLVILLIFTFFSNTIRNHSLPEVATQMVSNGTITAKVRGTGTVTAVGTHKVKATESITIGRVLVKSGQEVNAGDVLFVLGAADSTKLEEAYAALEDLQASYAQQAASSPILSQFVDEQNEVKRKRDTVTEKKRTVDELALELFNTNSEGAVSAAQEILDMFTRRDELLAQINSYKNDLYIVQSISGYATKISEVQTQIDDEKAKAEPNQETIDMLEAEKTRLTTEQASAQATIDAMTYSNETAINGEITRLQTEYDSISAKLDTSGITLEKAKKFISTYQEYGYAVDDVAAAQEALNNKLASQNQSVSASSASLTAISNKIKRQQEKIKKLSGEGDSNTITANVSGTVTEVNCTAGDSMIKDDILCAIEVPDQGYTVSFSVTNDQAKRLHVGDTATISNYYWGNEIVATLSSIQTDKKKPMTNKTLTFNLEGDVTSGSELTISVGQKSANYDIIIPNSAIRSDSNGSFVLKVTSKNSPLGNTYSASRVKIEVLAQDDNNAAVTADLSNGDYVITTSSAPISSGDMVRLADSEK